MIRTLLIIAGAGLVLAVAGLGGAAAVGGHDLSRNGWSWTLHDHDNAISITRNRDGAPPSATRTLAWTGGDSLTVDLESGVTYVQGETAGVVLTGPQDILDRVQLEDGRLFLTGDQHRITLGVDEDGLTGWSDIERLRVVVTAPAVSQFQLNGGQTLAIRGYDQPRLTLGVSGSGEIEAEGRTDALTLIVSGSGDADLRRLAVRDATVSVTGSGEADIAATGQARIDVSGSGDVTLHARPANLVSNVSGSGSIRQRG